MVNLKKLTLPQTESVKGWENLNLLSHTKFNFSIYCFAGEEFEMGSPLDNDLIAAVQNVHNLEILKTNFKSPISSATYKQVVQHAKKLSGFHQLNQSGNASIRFNENDYHEILSAILIRENRTRLIMTFLGTYIASGRTNFQKKLIIFNEHPDLTVYLNYTRK